MATQQLVQPHPTSNLQPDREGLRPGGWLLVAGALVSLGAGATPSMYAIYPSQTPQQFLRLVADRSGTWVGVHLAFLAGAVLTTLGLAALTSTLANSRGRALATIGLAVFIALTGIGLACYGAALLASRRLARWLGWTFVASGLLLALSVIVFGDGPPEAVELPLLLGGILALRQPRR